MSDKKALAKIHSELNTVKQKLAASGAKKGKAKKPEAVAYGPSQGVYNRSKASGTSITVKRSEIFTDVTTDANGRARDRVDLFPTATVLTWLNKLTKAYSIMTWNSLSICWKPAVSANTDGRLVFAVDVDGRSAVPGSRSDVASHSPLADCQIWQDSSRNPLVVPQRILQTRKRFLTDGGSDNSKTPGFLIFYLDGPASKLVGEFWVSYSVTFAGPR